MFFRGVRQSIQTYDTLPDRNLQLSLQLLVLYLKSRRIFRKGKEQMVYFQKMTPEGYQEIKAEMARLKKDRPRRIKILQQARSMGDLSENSEYTSAKRDLGHLQSRLRYLGKQLKYAQVIKAANNGLVNLGRTVSLRFQGEEKAAQYQIVGRMEADLSKNKIAFDSPLGQAVMKKKAGQTVTVAAPAGSYKVKITAVK